jgi:hypothetical protein
MHGFTKLKFKNANYYKQLDVRYKVSKERTAPIFMVNIPLIQMEILKCSRGGNLPIGNEICKDFGQTYLYISSH